LPGIRPEEQNTRTGALVLFPEQ